MPHRARLYAPTPRNFALLARALQAGKLVAAPTETVYGLAANALDPSACRRIFRAKNRPTTDPLIVHIASRGELPALAIPNAAALALAKEFWPGPLTLVLPKTGMVPDIVSAGLPSVAVRMPAHPLFRRLLRESALPLAAPSANPFGYISPTSAEHVRASLGRKIDYILDGGSCSIGIESTIVDLREPTQPRLMRPGAITREQLEQVLRIPVAGSPSTANPTSAAQAQIAPGLLDRHYSPRTPLALHRGMSLEKARLSDADEAWIFLARPRPPLRENIFWFDPRGELRGVARRLFAVLRQLDSAGFRQLHVEQPSGNDGLAQAINDRLRRAAALPSHS